MHPSTIPFKASQINYSFSNGRSNPIICFHGYGESEHTFHFLNKKLAADTLLIAIDLPYHGRSNWQEGINFTVADLFNITEAILVKHGQAGRPFTILAYSMGGRVALSLLQHVPARVTKLVLLAPDGLKINFWYWLSTQTLIGNKLFLATINYPGWFLGMINMARRIGLINPSIHKFVEYFLHDKSRRKQLYLRWTCMRKLKPNLDHIKQLIHEYKVNVRLIYGKHDRIILPARGEKFRVGIEAHCVIETLDSGHQLLQEKNAATILHYLEH